jgi:hypothetical protein
MGITYQSGAQGVLGIGVGVGAGVVGGGASCVVVTGAVDRPVQNFPVIADQPLGAE